MSISGSGMVIEAGARREGQPMNIRSPETGTGFPAARSLVFLKVPQQTSSPINMKSQQSQDKVHHNSNRTTQFAFHAPTARQVSLVGDFNNWDTTASLMHKGPDGVWHLGMALTPGRYEYRFFADQSWHNDPAAQEKAANSMGSENCVRVV